MSLLSTRICGNAPGLPPGPPEALLSAAQARHARRALEAAVDHGTALLAALGLPRLATPSLVPFDPLAIGEALEGAIAALDALDAPGEDLEGEGHDEPSLGWCERIPQGHLVDGFGDDEDTLGWTAAVCQLDLGPNTPDGEHTLGAPERHPQTVSLSHPLYEPADGSPHRLRIDQSQVSWAQGERQDGEGEAEAGYDLAEGDDERCASDDVDDEPSLGSAEDVTAAMDPARQWQADADRELDPLDIVVPSTLEQRADRARARQIGTAMVERAHQLRRGAAVAASATRGNLVPIALRVIGIRGLPWMGGRAHG